MRPVASLCAVLVLLLVSGCGGSVVGDTCGPDTHRDERGVCMASLDGGGPTLGDDAVAGSQDAGANRDGTTDDVSAMPNPDGASRDSGDPVDFDSACLVDDNVLVIYGPSGNQQQNGLVTIQGGTSWGAQSVRNSEEVYISTAADAWSLDFATVGLGVPMVAGTTYSDATAAALYTQGHPGLTVSGGNGIDSSCPSSSSGSFRVLDIDIAGTVVHGFTAVFTYPCPDSPQAPIRGCVRVRM